MPTTLQTFWLANALSRTKPITVNCSTHLSEATTRDPPIPRPRMRERIESKAMKSRPMRTFVQLRVGERDMGMDMDMVESMMAGGTRSVYYEHYAHRSPVEMGARMNKMGRTCKTGYE
jgi:hypothetical protein